MKSNRISVLKLMLLVLLAALDLALLRNPYFANKPLILAILVLEWGLFRWAWQGEERAYWSGFEVFGWMYVLVDFRYFTAIRYGIVELAQRPTLNGVFGILLRIIPLSDPMFFSVLTTLIENAATLLLAVAGGRLAARWARSVRVADQPL